MENISELTKPLLDWLALSDKLEKSDLIFVFGGPTLSQAKKAQELFSQGYSQKILVTGNTGTFNNPDWNKPIANIFADFLTNNEVPLENILIQNTSMNTLEDVTFSLPIIKNNFPHIQKIVLVSNPMHQRRCFATFKKQFPFPVEIINQSGDKPDIDKLNPDELNDIATRCIQECDRLIKYSTKGDIENTIIPPDINSIYLKLKQILNI